MDYKALFEKEMRDAGMSVSVEDFSAQFDEHLKNAGFVVNNQSPYSPFFRLQKALVAEPAAQLVKQMTTHVMPNSFVMLAQKEWLDIQGNARDIERLTAVTARGQLKISRLDVSQEIEIPAGTIVESIPLNGKVYRLVTENDCVLAIGQSTASLTAVAESHGHEYNLSAGYYVRVVGEYDGVNITNDDDWLITAGQYIESDENYRLRIKAAFAHLGKYHVDDVYKNIIATAGGIPMDNIALEKGAPRGSGTANAYVYLTVGTISQAIIDSINNHIAAGNHGLADDMKVFAMPTQSFDMTVTYEATRDISSDISVFIRSVFRENAAYSPTRVMPNTAFSFSLLAAELHNTFPELTRVSFNQANLSTGFWLPKLNELVVQHG
ncbi:baseplate J/gp47 family protein [Pseudoalteromonas sp. DY56-GL79]|uniref:baseplate J/gp47 family protein n=1 Tax=Pseudoalteromonas sp. DY56-GL79 TaxID=2967131 RepID=UPI00352BAAB2